MTKYVGNMDMTIELGEYLLHRTENIVEVEIEPMEQIGKTLIRIKFGNNSHVQTFINKLLKIEES